MSRDDWFRGTGWDRATQELFEEKLGRARSGRSQYLRIKGLELTGSNKADVRRAGRELLRRVLDEHADDELQVTMAHAELADSLASDGHVVEAAEHFSSALKGQRMVDTYADLGLVEVILRAHWADRYEEAEQLLLQSDSHSNPFPAARFRWNLAAARLASRRGRTEEAAELARTALRCLAETESPFALHREVGLASADRETVRELRGLTRL